MSDDIGVEVTLIIHLNFLSFLTHVLVMLYGIMELAQYWIR